MTESLAHRLARPVVPLAETDSVASAAERLLDGPLRSAMPAAATFAAAATSVKLPPKQAPSASAHQ